MKGLIFGIGSLRDYTTSFAQVRFMWTSSQWTDKENAVECAVMTKLKKSV